MEQATSSHDETLSHDEASHSDTSSRTSLDEQEQRDGDGSNDENDGCEMMRLKPEDIVVNLSWVLDSLTIDSREGRHINEMMKILLKESDGFRYRDILIEHLKAIEVTREAGLVRLQVLHTSIVPEEEERLENIREYEQDANYDYVAWKREVEDRLYEGQQDDQQLESESQESDEDTALPPDNEQEKDHHIPPGDRNGSTGAKSKSLKKRKRQQNTASDDESSDSESDDDDDDESETQSRKRPKAKASSKQVVPSTTSSQKQEEAAKAKEEQAQVARQQSDAKYTNSITTWEERNKDTLPQTQQQLVVGEVDLLIRLPFLIDAIMDPSQSALGLESLPSVATSWIRVIVPQIKAFHVVSSATAKKANNLARVFDNDASFGSILHACDSQLEDVDERMAGEIRRLKQALYQFMNPEVNDTTDVGLDKAVSDRQLMKFVKLGHPTRNMIQHLSNLVVVFFLIKELKLSAAVAHLSPKKAADLICRAEELAEIVNPRATLDVDNITVLSYLTQYINPGLGMADWELAAALLVALFSSISGCSSCFYQAQAVTVSGRRDEKGIDFFGGNQRIHGGRRTRACRSFALLVLKEAIKRRVPHGLFSNYTRSILLLSPSEIASHLYFVKEQFFDSKHGEDSDEVKRIRESVLKKELSNDGEVSLLLDNREQVQCLQQLLDMSQQLHSR